MRRTVPPSAEIQQRIDGLLAGMTVGEDPQRILSELARLLVLAISRSLGDASAEI